MNPFQNQSIKMQYQQRFEQELDKITISWNQTLKEWYPWAIHALKFASIPKLNIHPLKFPELSKKDDKNGLPMNVVSRLCNNLEERTPDEMGVDIEQWADILKLNVEVGTTWNGFADPVKKRLNKEFEIMSAKAEGMKIIKAEA